MFANTVRSVLFVALLAAPVCSFSVGNTATLGAKRMGLANDVGVIRSRPLALKAAIESSPLGMPLTTEKRLFGSRRLHRWLVEKQPKPVTVETELRAKEAAAAVTESEKDVDYVEVQPLVALMSKRRLTEYYFTTMGPSTYTLSEDVGGSDVAEGGAAFLEKHLRGVPDVLTMTNEEMYSNTQEHLLERTV